MYNTHNSYSFGFGSGMTPGVKKLIIINFLVFLLQMVSPAFYEVIVLNFGLTPQKVTGYFFIWQLFTYMFIHGDLFHIAFNMFVLWMFGSEIERHWGTKEFYKYYFITGVGAGLFNLIFQPGSPNPIIGASGAVYGLLAAFGMMFLNRYVLLFFIMPVKAKFLVIGLGILAFLNSFYSSGGNIAHLAHLGGMVVGYVYLRQDWRINRLFSDLKKRTKRPNMKVHWTAGKSTEDMRERVDQILDKINEVGYENLTEKEKEILNKASDFLNKK